MRRKLAIAGVAAAVLGTIALLLTIVPAGAISSNQTIHLLAKQKGSHLQDVGMRGPSIGDTFAFNEVLLQNGKRVGRDGIICTVVQVNPTFGTCNGIGKLQAGQIAIEGRIPFTNGPSKFTLAVTGGTGNYSNVRGHATGQSVSQTATRITLYLTP